MHGANMKTVLSRFRVNTLYDVRTTTKSPNDAFLRTYPRRPVTHICTYRRGLLDENHLRKTLKTSVVFHFLRPIFFLIRLLVHTSESDSPTTRHFRLSTQQMGRYVLNHFNSIFISVYSLLTNSMVQSPS